MHEYSIVQALLERVDHEVRTRNASHVTRVCVSIGEVSGVEIELLQTAFATIRHRTVCEEAYLEVRQVPAHWECRGCGAPIESGRPLRCDACGQPARLSSGDEIMLNRIEMEAP